MTGAAQGRARLILLNGLPGVGKSTVAAAWSVRHPGTLCLDIDLVRALISGDPRHTAEPARALGLAMAAVHLRGGHDVVVPQLVQRPDQVARFADAAARGDARLVHVLVEAPGDVVADRIAADAAPHRQGLDATTVAAYAAGLAEVARDPDVHRLANDEVAAAVDRLEELVRRR